jgi:hypothetical protein
MVPRSFRGRSGGQRGRSLDRRIRDYEHSKFRVAVEETWYRSRARQDDDALEGRSAVSRRPELSTRFAAGPTALVGRGAFGGLTPTESLDYLLAALNGRNDSLRPGTRVKRPGLATREVSMKRMFATAFVLALATSGVALAEGNITYGPEGDSILLPERQDVCQYGFQDGGIGWGWTLNSDYQLGITCPEAGCVSAVGFYVEFTVADGPLDLVVLDDGLEVSRTTLPPGSVFQGVNEFEIEAVGVSGTACVMLCPVGSFWCVTGEDFNSPPYGSSWQSNNCTCSGTNFLDNNLTIWVVVVGCIPVPTEQISWGSIRTLYR